MHMFGWFIVGGNFDILGGKFIKTTPDKSTVIMAKSKSFGLLHVFNLSGKTEQNVKAATLCSYVP